MSPDGNERTARANVGDAIGTAIPIDLAAEHINSNVLSALARWRDVDQFSLHDLVSTLWTESGAFAPDNVGYLRALHGFVAEKVAYDDLIGSHQIAWPEQTNVPALDMLVDGSPVQIKEGTSAYEQAQHALSRYPEVTSFITDPLTAQKLREHGVDAVGVAGLDPHGISSTTQESLLGLDALERAGQVHIPILTTVFSLCKYWERLDTGHIDAKSAVQFAATDVAAQSIGAAAGLKLAAIYVVATGGFAIAALPLSAGTILGPMGLRYVINKRRGAALRQMLQEFVEARAIVEMAAEMIADLSHEYSRKVLEREDRVAPTCRSVRR